MLVSIHYFLVNPYFPGVRHNEQKLYNFRFIFPFIQPASLTNEFAFIIIFLFCFLYINSGLNIKVYLTLDLTKQKIRAGKEQRIKLKITVVVFFYFFYVTPVTIFGFFERDVDLFDHVNLLRLPNTDNQPTRFLFLQIFRRFTNFHVIKKLH